MSQHANSFCIETRFCELSSSVIRSLRMVPRKKNQGKRGEKNQSLFGFMFQSLLAKILQSCEDSKVVNCIRKVQQVSEDTPYDGT